MLDSNSKRPFGGLDRESRKMQRVAAFAQSVWFGELAWQVDLEGFAHSKVKLNEVLEKRYVPIPYISRNLAI